MLYGRTVGLVLFGLGVLLSVIGYAMLAGAGYTIRLFVAGPAMVFVGLAMTALPGGSLTLEESKQPGFQHQSFLKEAPLSHKIAWGIAGLVGIFIAFNFIEI
ncbi:MAG: hypothetical protein AAF633_00545 [Chloroflexota bacterium]